MPPTIDWAEIALRLGLAAVAGAVLGLNRTERGMTAGLRTTLLVTLAAAIAMIEVNLLLTTVGKGPDSFATIDPMRLPLGILTGMGFIGGGAILRRVGRVSGVTTAATLWLATVLGLCIGSGQHGLGLVGAGLGAAVLWILKWGEDRIPQEHRGSLSLVVGPGGPADDEIRGLIVTAGGHISTWGAAYRRAGDAVRRRVSCQVHWSGRAGDPPVPAFVGQLVDRPGVRSVRWKG